MGTISCFNLSLTGRYASIASIAGFPIGTILSLLPLPLTRTRARFKSMSFSSKSASSEIRSPEE